MLSDKNKPIAFTAAALGFLLSIGTHFIFHACEIKEDGTWMHCHDAQNAVVLGGSLLTVLLIAAAVVKNKKIRIVLNGAGLIGAAVIFLLPGTLMPMCMMHTMRCYTVMQPFVRIMCALIVILTLYQTVVSIKK